MRSYRDCHEGRQTNPIGKKKKDNRKEKQANPLGQSQFLTTPVAAKPLSFSLALDDHAHDDEHNLQAQYGRGLAAPTDDDNESTITARLEDSDARLMEMLAAQAAHREVDSLGADEETIAADEKLSEAEKKDILQRSLNMAASNGDVDRVHKLVQGKASQYVDVNKPDEEGTVPLIYASCFVSGRLSWFCVAMMMMMMAISGTALTTHARAIKTWSPRCWMRAPTSTSRIGISGALSCGL